MRFRELHTTLGPGATWASPISLWGDATELSTWEGYAHCIEEAMRDHPWVDGTSLDELRNQLAFLDEQLPWMGCGEEHPCTARNMDEYVGGDRRVL